MKNYFGEEIKYNYGAYNKSDKEQQWIRITEGCPHNHDYCYEPKENKIFGIPEINRNDVKIMDMNLLCKPESIGILKELGKKRVDNRVVYYELVCGIDFRFLTQDLANTLKENRFVKIRLAWDFYYQDQRQIKKAVDMLRKAGYKQIMIFMICNWKISQIENLAKMDLCKIWNVQIADCYFDNQTSPKIIPIKWTAQEIKEFRKKVRKHNQLVNFGIDPELTDKQDRLF